jgi:hypothetical protein
MWRFAPMRAAQPNVGPEDDFFNLTAPQNLVCRESMICVLHPLGSCGHARTLEGLHAPEEPPCFLIQSSPGPGP